MATWALMRVAELNDSDRSSQGATRAIFAWVVRPFRLVTLVRWVEILVLAAAGSTLAGLVAAVLRPTSRRLGEFAAETPFAITVAIPLVIYSILLTPLIRLGAIRWGQWRSLVVYPPSWVAAVLGVLMLLGIEQHLGLLAVDVQPGDVAWPMAIWSTAPILSLSYWNITSLRKVALDRASEGSAGTDQTAAQNLAALAADPASHLIPWLERERPVRNPIEEDFFDGRELAEVSRVTSSSLGSPQSGLSGLMVRASRASSSSSNTTSKMTPCSSRRWPNAGGRARSDRPRADISHPESSSAKSASGGWSTARPPLRYSAGRSNASPAKPTASR